MFDRQMAEQIAKVGGGIVVGVWLIGLIAQLSGHPLHAPAFIRAGAAVRALAVGVGLPLLSGVVIVTTALSFRDPGSIVLLAVGAALFGVAMFGLRLIRRSVLYRADPSSGTHQL